MQHLLIPLNEDHKWKLLSEILNVFDSRTSRQILSRRGILPLYKSIPSLNIVPMSMFFSSDISYVVRETEERESLRKFLRISSVPVENEIYTTLSQYNPEGFIYFVLDILNAFCPKRISGSRVIIIDSNDINLNLNWHAKKISKKSLEEKEYKWGHSTHRGFFIGMKLTLALEYATLKPLAFLLNEANVPEAKIYPMILEELKKRRITKAGDILFADRGYYSYENYASSIREFKIIPLIFPRNNCNFSKLFNMMTYHLKIFDSKRDTGAEIAIYKRIIANSRN